MDNPTFDQELEALLTAESKKRYQPSLETEEWDDVEVYEYIKSDILNTWFKNIESEMNFSFYDAEELAALHATMRERLGEYMDWVSKNDTMKLTASSALVNDEQEQMVADATVTYANAQLIVYANEWRVAHVFIVFDEERASSAVVLPEHIDNLQRNVA